MDKRLSILVVDDEPVNIQLLSSALKDVYDILTAQDGYEAISMLKKHTPDLILLDVMMPDLNGFEVCKIIRGCAQFDDIPVIFISALDTYEGTRQGLNIGGNDYITKPVDLALLKQRVRNHLEFKERDATVKRQRNQMVHQKEMLEAALARVKQLEGIIPIGMYS